MTTANLSVTDNGTVVQYVSAGETEFTFPWLIRAVTEINVTVDAAVQYQGTDYTVDPAAVDSESGGKITFSSATTAGEIITIWLSTSKARTTGFATGASVIMPTALNDEFIALVRSVQQLVRDDGRALRLPIDDTVAATDMQLPYAAERAGKYLRFADPSGKPEIAEALDPTIQALSQSIIARFLKPVEADEIAVGATPVNLQYDFGDIRRYGAVGDDSTDCTAAIQAAINACEVNGGIVRIPRGVYRFNSTLLVTDQVSIVGDSPEKSVLKKVGNINGIDVTGNGSAVFDRFALDATGDTTGVGLLIKSSGRLRATRMLIQNHGSHGIQVGTASAGENCNLSSFRDLKSLFNGGDGMRIEGEPVPNINALTLEQLDLRGNTGNGLNVVNGWALFLQGVCTQANDGRGTYLQNAKLCMGMIYSENNTGTDVELSADSKSNILFVSSGISGLIDNAPSRANMIVGAKHQAEFEPNIWQLTCDEIHFSGEQGDGTDVIGNLTISHPADRVFQFEVAGTSSTQNINFVNNAAGNCNINADGDVIAQNNFRGGTLTSNTNTPSGATVRALEWRDANNNVVGYIPLYAAPW
jgi:hypothetical protein